MGSRFDRVLVARHFAICAGAVMAYVLRAELRIGYTALWIVALSALLNFGAWSFRTWPGFARACEVASPVIGVGSWTALIAVTNGVGSPFIAGLWLEIVLSAMALRPKGILYVTAGSGAALWAQQAWLGLSGVGMVLTLQTGFLVGMGGATYLVTRRWTHAQSSLGRKHEQLAERLDVLQEQLQSERALGRLGEAEQVGRLAHGLKNAIHSLRGFASLIEPRVLERGSQDALAGLRIAIDDLESLALLTLEEGRTRGGAQDAPGTPDARAAVERAIREISTGASGVSWTTAAIGANAPLAIPEPDLREVLTVLLRNAVEAMNGRGEGWVEMRNAGDRFRIVIRDQGKGLTPEAIREIFKPGYTTKPKGSGYGLFLARRIAKEHGGQLSARADAAGGATFELTLPCFESAAGDASQREGRGE